MFDLFDISKWNVFELADYEFEFKIIKKVKSSLKVSLASM